MKLIVVKYGGSVLDSGLAIKQAALTIKQELNKGTQIVVVASAIKGVTDQLLAAASTISENTPLEVIDHIIGLGEEQSVRLLSSALKSIGVDALEVTPSSPSWPIISDEKFGDAEPLIDECKTSVNLGLKPLIKRGKTPVVCGFIGRSIKGKITTLGRGGSDTTAVILASCLNADELVLVKDVGSIYSADPKIVEKAKPLKELSAWEAELIASTGAKILHEKVLKYKLEDLSIRIISKDQNLSDEGTIIKGTIPEYSIKLYEESVYVISILGDLLSEIEVLDTILNIIRNNDSEILQMQITKQSSSILLTGVIDILQEQLNELVLLGKIKAISGSKKSALFEIQHRTLDNIIVLENAINILNVGNIKVTFKMTSTLSAIMLVDYDKKNEALKILTNFFAPK
ncbi:hypothetical protein JW865_05360 [Candidatus Bathyarchaeota archaeon]|nr:hypothetical protein [Candidatus Bathyarchaeota archaeon]